MRNIHPTYVCGVIPPHILTRVAEQSSDEASGTARATLEHMRELAHVRATTLIERPAATAAAPARPRKRRNVYDAQHTFRLPGKLAMSEHKPRSTDVEVTEAYDGSGATYDFFAQIFRRASIDGRGMRIDSTVHYGTAFENALWNGRQMIYGHADGRIFTRFTASVDVIAHELTHGVTQFDAALCYHGQTGAINEHLSDAFGIMVKQYTLGQLSNESDWLIGAEILGPTVKGIAVRSMAAPGTAYDDPLLGARSTLSVAARFHEAPRIDSCSLADVRRTNHTCVIRRASHKASRTRTFNAERTPVGTPEYGPERLPRARARGRGAYPPRVS